MSVIISGTGLFTPEEHITNEELVLSFNDYVAKYNEDNKDLIASGDLEALVPSSSEFIKKASGIEQRFVLDKEGILDINRMMPRVKNEHPDRLSIHAEVGIEAAKKAMDQAKIKPG